MFVLCSLVWTRKKTTNFTPSHAIIKCHYRSGRDQSTNISSKKLLLLHDPSRRSELQTEPRLLVIYGCTGQQLFRQQHKARHTENENQEAEMKVEIIYE